MGNIFSNFYSTFIEKGNYKLILGGLKNTAIITICALLIGLAIGSLIAIIKYFGEGSKKMKPLVVLCDIYLTVIRGIPMVVLLLVFFFVIFASSTNGIMVAIIAFGINSGAYMAELIRSGINAVDAGQFEAGRSLGMSKLQTMRVVILPQAVRYILPAIGNEFIALLKETSVAGYVAVTDLTRAGTVIRNKTYDSISTLGLVAITYLVIVVVLTRLLSLAERKLAKNDKRH